MKLMNILESFEWNTPTDEQNARQISGLIKFNDGVFKSFKQAQFLMSNRGPFDWYDDASGMKRYFGVDIKSGERATRVEGMARWAEYGSRGNRPITWIYVFDNTGVTRKYKLSYIGDMRSGTRPDPNKTKMEWERPANADTSHLEQGEKDVETAKANSKSKHIGEIGKRMTTELTVKNVIDRGYNAYGAVYMSVFEDKEGNLFFYTGGRVYAEKGETITMTFGIKKHITTQSGDPATVIDRPRVKK